VIIYLTILRKKIRIVRYKLSIQTFCLRILRDSQLQVLEKNCWI